MIPSDESQPTVRMPRSGDRVAFRLMLSGAAVMLSGGVFLPIRMVEAIIGAIIQAGLAWTLRTQPEVVRARSAATGAGIALVSSVLTVASHLQAFGASLESYIAIAVAVVQLGLFVAAYIAVIRA